MTDLSPGTLFTAWRNAVYVQRWIESLWTELHPRQIREDLSDSGIWFWIVPNFDRGVSRVLGVAAATLAAPDAPAAIREALERKDLKSRLETEPLLVTTEASGLRVTPWNPDLNEQWFTDRMGARFVAYPASAPFSADPFLALDGKSWSAVGPKRPRLANTYSAEELLPYLPQRPATDLEGARKARSGPSSRS